MYKRIAAIIISFLLTTQGKAQLSGDFSVSTGNNYASYGQYAKLYGLFSYQYGDWGFSAATGTVFSAARENIFDALRLSVSKEFKIKNKPYEANFFYQRSPYSSRLNEHNAGLLLTRKTRRWFFNLGVNTRLYQLRNQYAKENSYTVKSLWEPVNVIYKITYHRPLSTKFEINGSVTNFDNFIIEQETNPFLMVDFRQKVSKKSKVYFDVAYQQAGFFNIRVNYFGYFLKAGYLFDINLTNKRTNNSH